MYFECEVGWKLGKVVISAGLRFELAVASSIQKRL